MNPQSKFRCPTGTRDLDQADIFIRNYITNIAKKCFQNCGAIQIDTPVIELYENIKKLYGEEFNKSVYKLRDDTEDLILRYDLTVPFARYVASKGLSVFRRYQIGNVYRLDEPQISKGRYLAFQQADFDIAGSDQGSGIFDMEILKLADNLLSQLLGKNFKIRLNDKSIIRQYLTKFGIEDDIFSTVCSSIDKLDKRTVVEICDELKTKGLDVIIIEKIRKFINDIAPSNNKLGYLLEHDLIDKKSHDNLDKFISQIDSECVVFDPLLARGLDYYTGIIYEAYYNDSNVMQSAICAGGRYDNLIGVFSNQGQIPAIGLSLGIDRIVRILEEKHFDISDSSKKVYVCSIGKNMVPDRVKLCTELRKRDVCAIMSYLENPKMKSQFDDVFNNKIEYMVIIGESEIKQGLIKIKTISSKLEETFDRDKGIIEIVSRVNK